MDEPLYFGHDYAGKNACKLSIAEVAQGVAQSVATIRSYHPHAKFILAEPQLALPGGPEELGQFIDAYKTAVGEYPASVRFDIQWRKNWRTDLPPFIAMLKARHIGFGVIYNAPGHQGRPRLGRGRTGRRPGLRRRDPGQTRSYHDPDLGPQPGADCARERSRHDDGVLEMVRRPNAALRASMRPPASPRMPKIQNADGKRLEI
jgi:hypothetical protein